MTLNKENTFTEKNRFLVYSDALNTVIENVSKNFDEKLSMISDSVEDLAEIVNNQALMKTNFSGTKIICVTDSWGTEGQYGVTKAWMHQVCDMLNATFIDLHEGSTGYTAGNTYKTRLTTWANAHQDELDEVAYIFASGSVNDYGSAQNTIRNAVKDFVLYCNDTFPNARVYLIPTILPPNPTFIGFDQTQTSNAWTFTALNVIASFINNTFERTVLLGDAPYILFGRNTNLMNADNTHPTQAGHNVIAKAVYDMVLGISATPQNKGTNGEMTVELYDSQDSEYHSQTLSKNQGELLYVKGNIAMTAYFSFAFSGNSSITTQNPIKLVFNSFVPIKTIGNLGVAIVCIHTSQGIYTFPAALSFITSTPAATLAGGNKYYGFVRLTDDAISVLENNATIEIMINNLTSCNFTNY